MFQNVAYRPTSNFVCFSESPNFNTRIKTYLFDLDIFKSVDHAKKTQKQEKLLSRQYNESFDMST